MTIKELLKVPEHEEHAAKFARETQKIIEQYEREHRSEDFSVDMSNSADDFVEQMNMELDEMDPDDPDREVFMSQITMADESTTIETGITLNVSSLNYETVELFARLVDAVAAKFSGRTDHLPLEESSGEVARYEKQLFYIFAG